MGWGGVASSERMLSPLIREMKLGKEVLQMGTHLLNGRAVLYAYSVLTQA